MLVVRVPRDLNHEWADPLRLCVARNVPDRDGAGVVLDMSSVEMISSIGIAALLQVQEMCKDRQARLLLAGMPQAQARLLSMLKLDRRFSQSPTVDDAVAVLDA